MLWPKTANRGYYFLLVLLWFATVAMLQIDSLDVAADSVLENLRKIDMPRNSDSLFDQLRMYSQHRYMIATLFFLFTLISEDISCVAAGLAITSSITTWPVALTGCIAGILFGDLTFFFLGYYIGRPVMRWWPFNRFFNDKQLQLADKWFNQNGVWVIALSRFTPGLRGPVYLSAGFSKMSRLKFTLALSISALLWAPMMIGLAELIGYPVMGWIETWEYWSILFIIPVILIIIYISRMISRLFTQSGRRQFAKWFLEKKNRLFG